MSYVNQIPSQELKNYEVISDWNEYYNNTIRSKTDPTSNYLNLYQLKVTKAIIETDVNFYGGEYKFEIQFDTCYFKGSLGFVQGIFEKSFTLANCFIDGGIHSLIGPVTFNSEFNIFSSFIKSVGINSGVFAKCYWHFSDCEKLFISGGDFKDLKLFISEKGVQSFRIIPTELEGNISVIGSGNVINEFLLSNPSKNLSLSLEYVKVNKLNVTGYRNDNGLRFLNIEAIGNNSEFVIFRTFLGKAEFYLIDLNSFNIVSFADSQIVECSFINVMWPKRLNSFSGSIDLEKEAADFTKNENLIKLRESYRQLKFAMSKQGDLINEQEFHGREMLVYNSLLDRKRDFWTKLIIKMSYWFSDFGQSFSRPFLALLIGHWLLFMILLNSGNYDDLHISLAMPTLSGFELGFERYWQLINPFRKTDSDFHGYRIVIDIFMRIWASYMIYNMIRATRRFIK